MKKCFDDEMIRKIFYVQSAILRMSVKKVETTEQTEALSEMTRVRFDFLNIINALEKTTVSDIARLTHTSKSSVSLTLTKLEKEGYIKRILPDENDDRRKIYIMLTKKGKAAESDGFNIVKKEINVFYTSLTKEKQQIFINLIESAYILFVKDKEEFKQ